MHVISARITAHGVVTENLGGLLYRLLKTMAEVQTEVVGMTIEALVERFPQEIVPYAVQLLEQLAAQFCRLVAADGVGLEAGSVQNDTGVPCFIANDLEAENAALMKPPVLAHASSEITP